MTDTENLIYAATTIITRIMNQLNKRVKIEEMKTFRK